MDNSLLKQVLKVVLNEINSKYETDYQLSQIEFKFKHNIMTNDSENVANEKTKAEVKQIEVNTILNVAANIGDEQALKSICEVLDLDYKELKGQVEKLQEEQNLMNAKAALEGAVVEDDTIKKVIPEGAE